MRCIKYLAIALKSTIVFGTTLEWSQLREKLTSPEWDFAAMIIVENWLERPADFFAGINESSWQKLVPLLSQQKISAIKAKEFTDNFCACHAFSKFLPELSEKDLLPKSFRISVCKLLKANASSFNTVMPETGLEKWIEEQASQAMESLTITAESSHDSNFAPIEGLLSNLPISRVFAIVKSIPVSWVRQDAKLIMSTLVSAKPPLLGLANCDTLRSLLDNPEGSCQLITFISLKSLCSWQLKLLSPSCMASIVGLKVMDLSFIVSSLRDNIFAMYNGPLSKETISRLSGPQLESYGGDLKTTKVCESLELNHVALSSFKWITSRCLYGYLERRWEVGLKGRWGKLCPKKLESFTIEMRNSWSNIHPGDFALMPSTIRRVLFSAPQVCANLDLSFVSPEVMREMSASCLHSIMSKPGGQIKLGKLWKAIEPETISSFTKDMMAVIKNVNVSEFTQMPPEILEIILKSRVGLENLPHPVDEIILSSKVAPPNFNQQQFAVIAEAAPNLAGQVLLLSGWLSPEILADCNGDALRQLTFKVPGQKVLNWSSLFLELEKRQELFFKEILNSMSTNCKRHFCATIKDLQEYLSLAWLRRNMNHLCRLAISFDLSDVFVFLVAPELARGMIPWRAMLDNYEVKDWEKIFADEDLAVELGRTCEFWATVNAKYQKVMLAVNLRALKRIRPYCIHRLGDFLKRNVGHVTLLANDAFSTHKVGDLPFSIKELSAEQIVQLSSNMIVVSQVKYPLAEKVEHVLSGVTLEEFKNLRPSQFKSLFATRQWKFVPEGIKPAVLEWHFQKASFILYTFIDNPKINHDTETILHALEIYTVLKQAIYMTSDDGLDFGLLVSFIRDSYLCDQFIGILRQHDSLKGLTFTLARNSSELREHIRESIKGIMTRQVIKLNFSQKTGFDRAEVLSFIQTTPKAFANPDAQIFSKDFNDHGGPMRTLISQLLGDIQRDLMTFDLQANSYKFIWGISQDMGMIIGLVFGKVVQLDLRLPFALHSPFYALLIEAGEEARERYHANTYDSDMANFWEKIKILRGPNPTPDESLLEVLTSLEFLRFARISKEVDYDRARGDFSAKTNIYGCGEGEGFKTITELQGDNFLEEYFSTLCRKILGEFKLFFAEFKKGLAYTIPLVEEFIKIPTKASSPFAEFLPGLLNRKPITANDLIRRVTFVGSNKPTLLQDENFPVSSVLFAFIRSLEADQLDYLVGIWTGSPNLSLDHLRLKVTLLVPDNRTLTIKLDFCNPIEVEPLPSTKGKPLLAPGEEYIKLFSNFIKELGGLDKELLKPDCPKGGLAFSPIRISTCAGSLTIYLQPVQQIFNSLVDIFSVPLTTLRDD